MIILFYFDHCKKCTKPAICLKKVSNDLEVHFRMSFHWSSGEISQHLSILGIKDVFDPSKAELRGIGPNTRISVNKIYHHVQLSVDELGLGESDINGKLYCNH